MSASDFLKNLDAPDLNVVFLPLDAIEPDPAQPRTGFQALDGEVLPEEQEELAQLADDIAAHGLLQPILVRELDDGRYQLIAGERRWRAFKLNQARGLAGMEQIPAIVPPPMDATELRLVQLSENQQRRNLTDIEIATFMKNLLDEDPLLQKQDLAKKFHKNSQYISRILAIVDPRWAHVVDAGLITQASVLEQFRSVPADKQQELIDRATDKGGRITTAQIREMRPPKAPPAPRDAPAGTPGVSVDLARQVEDILGRQAPAGEAYQPGRDAAPAEPVFIDHGGDALIPPGPAALSPALFDKQQVHLTLAQLAALLARGALQAAAHSVTLTLPVEDLKQAILVLGGEVPANDQLLALELIKRTNSL